MDFIDLTVLITTCINKYNDFLSESPLKDSDESYSVVLSRRNISYMLLKSNALVMQKENIEVRKDAVISLQETKNLICMLFNSKY